MQFAWQLQLVSIGKYLSIESTHVEWHEQDDHEVVNEAEHAEQGLGKHVERRQKVAKRDEYQEAEADLVPELDVSKGEKLVEQVTQKQWQLAHVVPKLSNSKNDERLTFRIYNIHEQWL